MTKTTNAIIAVCIVAVVVIAGVGVTLAKSGNNATSDEGYTVTLTDALGREVTFDGVPNGVLVTATMEVQTLILLGLGDKITAVNGDSSIDYSAYSDSIIGVTSYATGDVTKMSDIQDGLDDGSIATLDATWHMTSETISQYYQEGDLVLFNYTSYQYSDIGEQLDALGIKYFVCPYATDVEGVYDDILAIGEIFNRSDNATSMVSEIEYDLSTINSVISELTTSSIGVVATGYSSVYAYGLGYILGSIPMSDLGADNAFDITDKYLPITTESFVEANPDIVFDTAQPGKSQMSTMIEESSILQSLNFVENDKLYTVSSTIAYNALTTTSPMMVETYLMFVVVLYGDQLGVDLPDNTFGDDYQTYLQQVFDIIMDE